MAPLRLAVRLCLVAGLALATTVNSSIQLSLPPGLTANCGGTIEVRKGDTCASLADFGGLSLSLWQELNPSISCSDPTSLTAGSQVCIGDKLSFCNNLYYSNAGDTCRNIDANLGRIISSAGGKACSDPIPKGTPICVADSPNACAVDSIGGVAISNKMQDLLAGLPDYCALVRAPEAVLEGTQIDGIQSLQLTLSGVTQGVQQILANAGHPELNAFKKQLLEGGVQSLVYTFVPGYLPGNGHLATFDFNREGDSSSNRKLQAQKAKRKRWYGGTKISVNWSWMKYL